MVILLNMAYDELTLRPAVPCPFYFSTPWSTDGVEYANGGWNINDNVLCEMYFRD
jgi:hypothetical protein